MCMDNFKTFLNPATGPLCAHCDAPAKWQLGTYVPFKSRPVYFCDAHFPTMLRERYEVAVKEKEKGGRRALIDGPVAESELCALAPADPA